MATLPVAQPRAVSAFRSLKTGLAFAVTVALFYALCTLVWQVAPTSFMAFMNSLFHGMDFTPLIRSTSFSALGFIEAIAGLAVWAFMAGATFDWLRQQLG